MSTQSIANSTPARSSSLLRTMLMLDGEFCLILGLVLAIFAGWIARWAGDIPMLALVGLGVGLVVYGGGLLWLMRDRDDLTGLAKVVIGLNIAWVAVSVVMFLAGGLALTPAGMWAAAIVDDIVVVLAVLQYIGLRRASR